MAVCQNLVPLVNIKIAGKWMFIPLKMVLIGIDPYPYHKISKIGGLGAMSSDESRQIAHSGSVFQFLQPEYNDKCCGGPWRVDLAKDGLPWLPEAHGFELLLCWLWPLDSFGGLPGVQGLPPFQRFLEAHAPDLRLSGLDLTMKWDAM